MMNRREESVMQCDRCHSTFITKVRFLEEERIKGRKTGRVRDAVSHLLCEECGRSFAVDDTFDGPWMSRTEWDRLNSRSKPAI